MHPTMSAHAQTHTQTHPSTHTHTHTHTYTHTHTHAWHTSACKLHVYAYKTCIYISGHIYTCIYKHICEYIYACVYKNTTIHTYRIPHIFLHLRPQTFPPKMPVLLLLQTHTCIHARAHTHTHHMHTCSDFEFQTYMD
jgi:hypothetical protein